MILFLRCGLRDSFASRTDPLSLTSSDHAKAIRPHGISLRSVHSEPVFEASMDRMVRLPRSLLIALVILSAGAFTGSLYLEETQLVFLQEHPIMTNLLSGVVGFSTAAVVAGAGFNWYTTRTIVTQNAVFIWRWTLTMLQTWVAAEGRSVRSDSLGEMPLMFSMAKYSPRTVDELIKALRSQDPWLIRPARTREESLAHLALISNQILPAMLRYLGDDSQVLRDLRAHAERDVQLAIESPPARRGPDTARHTAEMAIDALVKDVVKHPTVKRGLERYYARPTLKIFRR